MRDTTNDQLNSCLVQFGEVFNRLAKQHQLGRSDVTYWRWDHPSAALSWKEEDAVEANINVLFEDSAGALRIDLLETNVWIDLPSAERMYSRDVILSGVDIGRSLDDQWVEQQAEKALVAAEALMDELRDRMTLEGVEHAVTGKSPRTRTRTAQRRSAANPGGKSSRRG